MKIHVSRVPAEGLRGRATYGPTTMDMDRVDIHLREPFEVEAFITKAERELVVQVEIRCPLYLSCGRCLEAFAWTVRSDTVFSYRVQPTDIVDITEDVRQEIVLAYPMIPVCRPDCKGLCSTCGRNLNLTSCVHHVTASS